MFKCIYCGHEAEYIYHGDSICAEHMRRKTNPDLQDQLSRIVKLKEWGLIDPSMTDDRIADVVSTYIGMKISADQVERIRARIFART